MAAQPEGIDLDLVLLGLATKRDDVDDPRHLFELPFQDPILGCFQLRQRISLADDLVPEDLPNRIPGGNFRGDTVGQVQARQPIEDLLPRVFVLDAPGEIAFDVGQAEERLAPHMFQARHAGELGLQRGLRVAIEAPLPGRIAVEGQARLIARPATIPQPPRFRPSCANAGDGACCHFDR